MLDIYRKLLNGTHIAWGKDDELSPRRIRDVLVEDAGTLTVVLDDTDVEGAFSIEAIEENEYTFFADKATCKTFCDANNASARKEAA